MSIFDLHQKVISDYRSFIRSFILIADERARAFVDKALEDEGHLWPEPMVQLSPAYAPGPTVDELAKEGLIAFETAQVFRRPDGTPFRLYRHQEDAIRKALSGESFVVTSGTGSGKSLCYFLPVIDSLIRNPGNGDQVVDLVVYPMNALVNSQYQALINLKELYEKRTGKNFPVKFAKYTGETTEEQREQMRLHPPQVLLTNYVMAEFLLVRPEDKRFLERMGVRFLVFDELHTYRGRQGADVAMLIRRLKERCGSSNLIHIATSATMISKREATPEERKSAVAEYATRFFGYRFTPDQIIEEVLAPLTEGGMPLAADLKGAMAQPLPENVEDFRRHPLVRWVEYELGIEPERGGGFKRRTPRALSECAEQLSHITGASPDECLNALQKVLIHGGRLCSREGTGFAFKLHQFISQGRSLYATLEDREKRLFSLEGQIQAEQGKLFVPVKFCRQCGQEYYHVLKINNKFIPHPAGGEIEEQDFQGGYLMLAHQDDDWSPEKLPEEWFDSNGKLRPTWKDRIPEKVWVFPDGTFSLKSCEGAVPMWWQREPFSLCLSCGEFYTAREQEFTKLASLSSEGRSSATTILATSLLRHAVPTKAARDKLLTFTDNRQDASLQAGHFNDFVHVALLRAALYSALKNNNKLYFDRVADEVVRASGLTISDIARNSQLDPASSAARDVWKTFTELTEYRLYEDLRRGWRFVHPNLEQVGLLKIEYRGLDELCGSGEIDSVHDSLSKASFEKKKILLRTILNHFRRKLAVNARVLEETFQKQLRKRSEQHLNEFWGLDPDYDELRTARYFGRNGTPRRGVESFSLSERSLIGRFICYHLKIGKDEYAQIIDRLLDVMVRHGLLIRSISAGGQHLYQLDASCLVWCLGNGLPPAPDPLYTKRASDSSPSTVNKYFQEFYRIQPVSLAVLEAREHTAQVVREGERERRERRFRWEDQDRHKESELGRRLPYLVCSPTMELGIDIADLELVHMRNVPPTPANYAQRSGRAGRQGQPGLILTYCGSLNNHDQYFFRRRTDMVAGTVRPPRLDLANEALLQAHIHAVWLSHICLPLGKSIENVIDTSRDDLPLIENAARQIQLTESIRNELKDRVREILAADEGQLRETGWFSERWINNVIEEAPRKFDQAFDRWRELYRAAKQQLNSARAEEDRARNSEDQNRARQKQEEARRQLNLLLQIDVAREEGDFYPYRYLASEGFLPGYNFPALPVRAWVPRGREGEFISRSRFLAIREFAPNNLLYHEGTQWESVSFMAPPGGLERRRSQVRFCLTCGAFSKPDLDICPVCHTLFDGENSLYATVLDMPNVRMQKRARITADEEERRRRGYEIETFFQFSPEGRGFRVHEADVVVDETPIMKFSYAPAANIIRVNHGWRMADQKGFLVNFENGEIIAAKKKWNHDPSNQKALENVRLVVSATQNLLLIHSVNGVWAADRGLAVSLCYALKRGIEEAFQLEESELIAQLIGRGNYLTILLFETAEGGAGVLRRMVEESNAISAIARSALEICHFGPAGEDLRPDCYAACYECLLSYGNQQDSLVINRKKIKQILLDLSNGHTELRIQGRSRKEHLAWLRSLTDSRSELERKFLEVLDEDGLRLPDEAQKKISTPSCIPDFFYRPNICVFCDGSVHDEPGQAEYDRKIRDELIRRGYRVIVIRYHKDLREQIKRYPEVFGIV